MQLTHTWRSTFLAAIVTLTPAAVNADGGFSICGDYNRDRKISAGDALGTLRTAVKLGDCLLDICDFTGDAKITSADALAILRLAVALASEAKCPFTSCAEDDADCCDWQTCSGHGTCAIDGGLATCKCDEGWVGATCNAEAERYRFAKDPTRTPPTWTANGDLFVRPPSYREQMRYRLRPGTFFVANSTVIANVKAGKISTTMPLVFPDGQLGRFTMEKKDSYTPDVLLVDRKSVTNIAKITKRYPQVTVYRSLYESDGSVRSVMQILAVDDGGFVSRGVAKHESNQPDNSGVFALSSSPISSTMKIDDIVPVNGTINDSSIVITEAFFADDHQAELFDDCDGLSICSDLCADTGLDQGDPGPACPPPPDPCEHVSPCGDGHGPGDPPATHQCNDGDDNDGDELTDNSDPECDHSPSCEPGGDIPEHIHRFEAGADLGMFGDVVWCTNEGDNWPSRLLDRGYFSETPFHKDTGWPAYDSLYKFGDGAYNIHEKLVRLKTIGCWRLETTQQASDCSNDLADCGAFAAGPHTYPYHFGRDSDGFWKGLKVDVWHARSVGMTDPLNIAHTVTAALVGNSEAESIPGFASVAGSNTAGQDASPHELGHSLNLTHCDVRLVNGLWTLEGNQFQTQTCPPGDYGSHQIVQWSDKGGEKLHECFINGCPPDPKYGDPTP